jgi:predicted RNA binding protein YcfA (HicA-like mRNA interferase family)
VNRLPRVSGRAVVRALERAGFVVTHTRGSHVYLRKPDTPGLVTVPVHAGHDLPPGTLRSILRQANLTSDELAELLRG